MDSREWDKIKGKIEQHMNTMLRSLRVTPTDNQYQDLCKHHYKLGYITALEWVLVNAKESNNE